jgi:GNAT superfamily N-acetyltransferase
MNETEFFVQYSRFRVAEIDGRIAGGLCTHTEDHDTFSLEVNAARHIGLSYPEIVAGFWRLLPYYRVHIPILENTLVVEFVATFPEFRRRGVITALLEDAIDKARREGYPRLQVTTFIGNVTAQRAYEKVGFRVDKERTGRSCEKLFGSPGQVRLTLEL